MTGVLNFSSQQITGYTGLVFMHPPLSSFCFDISTYQHITATSTQKTRNQLLDDAAYLRRMKM
jgi:phage gp36-like protein